MASVNKAIILGNLGRDPDVRATQSGGKIVQLNVATTEKWKDGERTEWHRVVVFNERSGDFAEKYLRKGSTVYIEGQIQTRKWTDKEGNDKYTTEIVVPKFGGEVKAVGGKPDQRTEQKDDPLDGDGINF